MNAACEMAILNLSRNQGRVGFLHNCVVGGLADGLESVTSAEVTDFDSHVSVLDIEISSFDGPDLTPDQVAAMTPGQIAAAAMGESSLHLRWKGFLLTWRAWRDQHVEPVTRLADIAAVELGRFKVEYNAFLAEFNSIGGKPSARPMSTDPPPKEQSMTDKFLHFLDSTKWILGLGLVAYVLVGSGAGLAIGSAVSGAFGGKK